MNSVVLPDVVELERAEEEFQYISKELRDILNSDNIAKDLEGSKLQEIGAMVVRDFDIDLGSQSEASKEREEAIKLAKQVSEQKDFPFPKASNIKYPLLFNACLEFWARSAPQIIQNGKVCSYVTVGNDRTGQKYDSAIRYSDFQNYQLIIKMREWERDTDRLLLALPLACDMYRKITWDDYRGVPKSTLKFPDEIIVNSAYKTLEDAPRYTEVQKWYKQDILSKIRKGYYLDLDLDALGVSDNGDKEKCFEILEHYCYLDLDDDGFGEPYTVCVHRDSGKVLRIAPRFTDEDVMMDENGEVVDIEAEIAHVHYQFMPSLDGSFQGTGFGTYLPHINKIINTTINQMLDAGTLQNTGGGFISKNIKTKGRNMKFALGEYKPVDVIGNLGDNIYSFQHQGPSPVLFQLLGFIVDAGKSIAGLNDIFDGNAPPNQAAFTTAAVVEEGVKMYRAVFKGVWRGITEELRRLSVINKKYLEVQEYADIMDVDIEIAQSDLMIDEDDITPIADPEVVTEAQKLSKANFLMQFKDDPLINQIELRKRVLTAGRIDNVDDLIVEPQQQPDPIAEKIKSDERIAIMQAENKRTELALKQREMEANISNIHADTVKKLAEAEAAESGSQLDQYMKAAEAI